MKIVLICEEDATLLNLHTLNNVVLNIFEVNVDRTAGESTQTDYQTEKCYYVAL